MKKGGWLFWGVTGVLILLSHDVMVFLHEWTHSFLAWLVGYKDNPFAIRYPTNWLTLWGIDENVPYREILSEGKNSIVAMIALAPMISGGLFFWLGLMLLSKRAVQKRSLIFAFVYWWTLMEISEIYSYVPIRTFINQGDIYNFLYATGLSPWSVFIPGTLFVMWGMYRMMGEEARACMVLGLEGRLNRFMFLLVTLLIMFAYFGGIAFAFVDPQLATNVLSWSSLALVPLGLIVLRKRYEER